MTSFRLLFIGLALMGLYSTNAQFNLFEAENDLSGNSQSLSYPDMITTADGNLIVTAHVTCYTPNATTIEGCNRGFELRKVDFDGNLIWMSHIDNFGESIVKLIENMDKSLTLFSTGLSSVACGASIVGNGSVSYMYLLNSEGEVVAKRMLNDMCELSIGDVIPYGDTEFLMIGNVTDYFNEPHRFHVLFTIEREGTMTPVQLIGEDNGRNLKLLLDNQGNLILFDHRPPYVHYREFDNMFSVSKQDSIKKDSSFNVSDLDFKELNNGNYLLSFEQRHSIDDYELTTIMLDENKQEINRRIIPLGDYASNLIQLENNELCFATSSKNNTNKNAVINYLNSENLESTGSYTIDFDQNETPQTILETSDNIIQITGDLNCCNFDETTGPAKVFILNEGFAFETSSSQSTFNDFILFPNPTEGFITLNGTTDHLTSMTLYGQDKLIKQFEKPKGLQQLDFSELPSGIYFLRMDYTNEIPQILRFVKL